jgi:hypothetical protein
MQKWEYKVLEFNSNRSFTKGHEKHLNKLGEEGWELVSEHFKDWPITIPGAKGVAYTLKRPKGMTLASDSKNEKAEAAGGDYGIY